MFRTFRLQRQSERDRERERNCDNSLKLTVLVGEFQLFMGSLRGPGAFGAKRRVTLVARGALEPVLERNMRKAQNGLPAFRDPRNPEAHFFRGHPLTRRSR